MRLLRERLLPLFLAFALCLGPLSVPALAARGSYGPNSMGFSYTASETEFDLGKIQYDGASQTIKNAFFITFTNNGDTALVAPERYLSENDRGGGSIVIRRGGFTLEPGESKELSFDVEIKQGLHYGRHQVVCCLGFPVGQTDLSISVACELTEPNKGDRQEGEFTIENGVLIKYNGNGGHVVIPDGVVSIGDGAFFGCKNLTGVVIPSSVTDIGNNAFSSCENLKSVTIPSSVTSVGSAAFAGAGLSSVTVPQSVTSLGKQAFDNCRSLASATLECPVKELNFTFYGCTSLASVTLPSSVALIRYGTFAKCPLTDIYFGGSQSQWDAVTKESGAIDGTPAVHWAGGQGSGNVTVSFDSNGGGAVAAQTVSAGKPYGALPSPVRPGYRFGGWYTAPSGGEEATASTVVTKTENHTLYARWTETEDKLVVSPGQRSFGKLQEGYAQPAVQIVTVKNAGAGTVALSQPSAGSFELGKLSASKLEAGDSAVFTVRPKAGLKEGNYSETIAVKTVDGEAAASLTVDVTVEKGDSGGAENPGARFTDVRAGAYYCDAVLWAAEKGVASGVGETSFAPDDVCTRGQVVTFLWRAAGKPEPKSSASLFADAQDPKAYYYKAALWAAEKGVASGVGETSFAPDDVCTRGQVVTFLWRTYR